MPRVEKDAEVTLVCLVYRSLKWLDFVMEGVDASKNTTRYRWLVVANDATEEVRSDPRISVDFDNEDPDEYYLKRVYRAWNEGVLQSPTSWVVMLNSDMTGADYWLDELVATKRLNPKTVPTSLLVESGRIPSAMPEWVKNFGADPERFPRKEFQDYADKIRKPGGCSHGKCGCGSYHYVSTEPGRLFMPILVDRQEFMDIGSYPIGNPPGTTGDKDLIRRYAEAGFQHVTSLGSVVYHTQEGEMRDNETI
jgi:hypothetical protein